MQVATTTTRSKPKPFAWSYSKIKNYESCPKRHWHVDIQRDVVEPESEELKTGNYVHKILAERIGEGKPLPAHHKEALEPWAQRVLTGPGKIYVEQKYGLTESLTGCEFFAKNVWYRGIGDVVKVHGPVALILDWKTGKVKDDPAQLFLMAACIFGHFPEVQKVKTRFIWLKEDCTTDALWERGGMGPGWADMYPRIIAYKQAVDTTSFPAKPGFLCRRWCPVAQCPHHGE